MNNTIYLILHNFDVANNDVANLAMSGSFESIMQRPGIIYLLNVSRQ